MQFKYRLSSCKEYDYKQYVLDQDFPVIRCDKHENTTQMINLDARKKLYEQDICDVLVVI